MIVIKKQNNQNFKLLTCAFPLKTKQEDCISSKDEFDSI